MRNLSLVEKLGVFAVVLLIASCSDDDDGSTGPGTGNGCVEYTGSPEPIPSMRDQCLQDNGVVSETCSRTGASGSCTIASGASSIKTVFYGLDADGLNTARQSCQAGGAGVWADGA